MRILAISGSLRTRSSNTQLLYALPEIAPTGMKINFYHELASIPHFTPDLDIETPPDTVFAFRQQLQKAEGIIICTPEYAFGIPGTLKNALDWTVSSGDLHHKPVFTIAASPLSTGGDKAHTALLLTLKALGAYVPEEGALTIPMINKKLSSDGMIMDAETSNALRTGLIALAQAIVGREVQSNYQ